MKNIKFLIFGGILVIITSLICFTGRSNVYRKKINYNSPEEIINVLNTKTLNAYDKNDSLYGEIINTDDFKECLSKRKRITGSLLNFTSLNVQVDSEYDEENIKNSYFDIAKHLYGHSVSDNVKAYSLSGSYVDPFSNSTGNIKMELVFIEEGEGYVIDYIKYIIGDNVNNINIE